MLHLTIAVKRGKGNRKGKKVTKKERRRGRGERIRRWWWRDEELVFCAFLRFSLHQVSLICFWLVFLWIISLKKPSNRRPIILTYGLLFTLMAVNPRVHGHTWVQQVHGRKWGLPWGPGRHMTHLVSRGKCLTHRRQV